MFAEAYRDVLTVEQREALRAATSLMLGEYHDDLATLSESGEVAFRRQASSTLSRIDACCGIRFASQGSF